MSNNRQKIIFICTEDWFFQSHFLPLGEMALTYSNGDVAIITTTGKVGVELERKGLKILPADFMRSSKSLFSVIRLLWRLIILMRRERPALIHLIALKPILIGGLAALFVPKTAIVYHVTGLGYLAEGKSRRASLVRMLCFRLLALYLKRRKSWLVVENPDDLSFLLEFGVPVGTRTSILGGAGVDPNYYPALPADMHQVPHIAYVGRMIWSKGVDVLVAAKEELISRGVELKLDMFGAPDTGNPHAIQVETLQEWNRLPGVKWHGTTSDVRNVWRKCAIAVVPTRTREGMPRAMLEAAVCARPLIVTDVPGCRHFVRDGVEGLIVPPEDSVSLANAIERLAHDPQLRAKMGRAARKRVLEGYTHRHVQEAVLGVYRALLESEIKEK